MNKGLDAFHRLLGRKTKHYIETKMVKDIACVKIELKKCYSKKINDIFVRALTEGIYVQWNKDEKLKYEKITHIEYSDVAKDFVLKRMDEQKGCPESYDTTIGIPFKLYKKSFWLKKDKSE